MPLQHSYLILLVLLYCASSTAEIYTWTDEQGQVHYGDSDSKSTDAEKVELAPANSAVPVTIQAAPIEPAPASSAAPPAPVITASSWAAENCQTRVRILYTERPFIPCVPTDEVKVMICQRQAPRKFRRYFGRQYRYQDRESECGPEVYEGEILYLKK